MIRMSNLTDKQRLPQLRMASLPGIQPPRYERMVCGKWVMCNHSRADLIVGVFNRMARRLWQQKKNPA